MVLYTCLVYTTMSELLEVILCTKEHVEVVVMIVVITTRKHNEREYTFFVFKSQHKNLSAFKKSAFV